MHGHAFIIFQLSTDSTTLVIFLCIHNLNLESIVLSFCHTFANFVYWSAHELSQNIDLMQFCFNG